MADCLFCAIVAGDVPAQRVAETARALAFRDINPQAPTHVLIIPRKHIPSLDDLGEGDAAVLGNVVGRIADIARRLQLSESGYRVVVNTGENAGQMVFHVHFHILGGRNFGWPPG